MPQALASRVDFAARDVSTMPTTVPSDVVTLVIQHQVRPGCLPAYEAWLKRALAAAEQQPGHLGVNVIRVDGQGDAFTTVLRFAEGWQLDEWIASDRRRLLIDEVLPLLEGGDQIQVSRDHEFWFTPEHAQASQPPKWKQAVLTYLVICPLTMIIPQLWLPLFQQYPALGGVVPSNLLITLCIVVPVVFWIMPAVTRWCAGWLSAR